MSADPCQVAWRTGRSVGRTVYAVTGGDYADDDELIGVMDTPGLALEAVLAHNQMLEAHGPGRLLDAVQRVVELAGAGEVYLPHVLEALPQLCTAWQDFVECTAWQGFADERGR